MSKRSDTIRSLFSQQAPAPAVLSADNATGEPRRAPAGAVRSMRDTFSSIERENESLRAQFADGEHILDVDPALIDPSPFADRFALDDDPSFDALKQSIAERGQEIPVLLRPHPNRPGRYQTAFGHRRIRVAVQLDRSVKSIVRPLSDDELIVAQGVENSAREDLSFIERAVFALTLETAGRSRTVIQQALAIDRAETSKLISVAKAVPNDFVRLIGKAPKIGRRRWQEFADALTDNQAIARVKAVAEKQTFAALDSDARFARALSAAAWQEPSAAIKSPFAISDGAGQVVAHVRMTERDVKVTLAKSTPSAFAEFLADRLPELFDEFRAFDAPNEASDN